MYQELVNKCKQAYKDKNLRNAWKYWEEIYNISDKKLDNLDLTDDKQRLDVLKECQKYINQFTDDEVYEITNYGKKVYEQ